MAHPFVCTVVLKALTMTMFLHLIASQCMDYKGMKVCSSAFNSKTDTKDLLECMNDCLVKPGNVCRSMQWKRTGKLCHVDTDTVTFTIGSKCATFRKSACNNIPDDENLEEDSGNIFKLGQTLAFVASLEECKTVCALGRTCQAFTWLSGKRRCIIHRQSKNRSTIKLKQGDSQVIKSRLRPKGRCVVLNAGWSSPFGMKEEDVHSLQSCVETVLNTSFISGVDWNIVHRECWSHYIMGPTYLQSVGLLVQLQKHQGCRLWQGTVILGKHEHTKMSGGMKLKGLSKIDCVKLCQLVSNCAAVGWSNGDAECSFHQLKLSMEEDPSSTLYTARAVIKTTFHHAVIKYLKQKGMYRRLSSIWAGCPL